MFQNPEKHEQLRSDLAEARARALHRIVDGVENIARSNRENGIEGDTEDLTRYFDQPTIQAQETVSPKENVIDIAEWRAKQLARSAQETDLNFSEELNDATAVPTVGTDQIRALEQMAENAMKELDAA